MAGQFLVGFVHFWVIKVARKQLVPLRSVCTNALDEKELLKNLKMLWS